MIYFFFRYDLLIFFFFFFFFFLQCPMNFDDVPSILLLKFDLCINIEALITWRML